MTDTSGAEPQAGVFRSTDAEVTEQLVRARAQAGEHFDEVPLALTLLLHRTTAALVRATHFDFEPLQMNTTQFNVMTVLHRSAGPMTMGALAESVSVRAANLTSVVDGLRTRKLVSKKPSADDRRSYVVSTTAQGDALMRRFLPNHMYFMNEFYAGLDPQQQRTLAELLDRLLESLRPDGEHRQLGLPDRVVNAALSVS
ncbi:MarR family winged helix-turn-helix transcriptional regulator [Streptomyces sp. NPDC056296]|uniref:MarR family winged helix-turn-helix transcriptional regulator n=1 Tax=Streptomyces sp. NPDC056296 TaxID=3345775 RepID=UPI0035DB7806